MTRAERPRICVVGDVLADSDLHGRAERLSPDAPVPVVDERDVVHRAGGAGLAATLATRAGGRVTLVTALADDEPARRLRDLLGHEGVHVLALPWIGTTVEKIRIGAEGVPMIRLDRGAGHVAPDMPPQAARAVAAAVTRADAVLVADYGRGVAAHPLVHDALAAARDASVPVLWDPHPRGPSPLAGAALVCPNDAEAAGYVADVTGAGLAAVVERARRLRRRWDVGAVAVTRGREGAVVVLGDGAPLTVPVLAPAARGDTCGAGDAFASGAAIAMGCGAVVSEAVQVAVDAAAGFVAAGGAAGMAAPTRAPTRQPDAHARTFDERGGTLVATGGCFDILHPGHVHTIRAARLLGDRLVVLVNDDDSVRRLKGPDRPLQPVEDRCAVLRSLADVDDVVVFGEDTPVDALRRLRPDVFVKGGDYTAAELPETAVLAEWGGSVVTVPFLAGRSTTELVTRARRGPGSDPGTSDESESTHVRMG